MCCVANNLAGRVAAFYESHPYPHQWVQSRKDLEKNEHSRVIQRILGTVGWQYADLKGKRVLDAGCGTGEKALFCALKGAQAEAFDISKTSIKIARENASRLSLPARYSIDSYEEFTRRSHFDLILCIGSLHHTSDAKGNFMRMARLLAPKGRIALGLYSTYGRLGCRMHRKLLWHNESDPERVLEKIGAHKVENRAMRASLSDRYGSPHETYHSIEEALGWFKDAGIAPIATYPRVNLSSRISVKASQLSWLAKSRGFFFIGGVKSH